ncbi:hypothetical protein AAMO2058_000602500 [Amorphochlora amoebiformis]
MCVPRHFGPGILELILNSVGINSVDGRLVPFYFIFKSSYFCPLGFFSSTSCTLALHISTSPPYFPVHGSCFPRWQHTEITIQRDPGNGPQLQLMLVSSWPEVEDQERNAHGCKELQRNLQEGIMRGASIVAPAFGDAPEP